MQAQGGWANRDCRRGQLREDSGAACKSCNDVFIFDDSDFDATLD
jgi:hypothetical protein